MASQYHLIGYSSIDPEEEFGFVIPIFSRQDKLYQFVNDYFSSEIKSFIPVACKYEVNLPDKLNDVYRGVGDPAIYFYSFKGKLFFGNKLQIGVQLIKLMKYEKISSIDQYDIYSFLEISEKVDESIERIIREFKDFDLSAKNFYKAEKQKINFEQFKEKLIYYAQLIESTGKKIVYTSYFPAPVKNGCLTFNNFFIEDSDLEDNFDNALDAVNSAVYRDLVVHAYKPLEDQLQLAIHPRYRLRTLFNVNPVLKAAFEVDDALINNSQSPNLRISNAAELGWRVSSELLNDDELLEDLISVPSDSLIRISDAKRTRSIRDVIKEGENK